MGRSGAGGGGGRSGGFSHSSGSRGFSRSGGSSSRSGAGSSSRSGSSFSSGPIFSNRGVSYHRHYHSGPSVHYGRSYSVGGPSGGAAGILVFFMAFILIVAVFLVIGLGAGGGAPQSTIQRERVDSTYTFDRNCVVDELGWLDNRGKLTKGLEYFYKETGVQPWIVLTYVTSETDTDAKREAWVKNYFDTNCNPSTFMYVYFETDDTSVKGPDVVWWGDIAASVMDTEAVDIFLNYLDSDWVTWDVDDTDGMFVHIFEKTANTIMRVSTTGKDIMKYVIIFAIVVVALIGFVVLFNKKRDAERERAAETERILQAGQNQATYGSPTDAADDLTSKYD